MNIKRIISKALYSSTISLSLLFNNLYAGTHQAICAYYSGYSPCRVTISNTHIESNLPTDYLYVDKDNFLDLKVYEDLGKSSNLVVGTVSTLLLGPIGLLGFLVKKKSGTIDYAVSFEGDRGRTKTAFIRFKNMKAAAAMGEELPELLKNISVSETNQQ
tara:strand:- start:2503 stop:2979 length:477 start_codon:yes stop_codon:yes gene_type:complete